MIFTCNGLDLADALTKISLALPQRKLSAVLDGIKIEAEGDFVKLTATDIDFTIVKKIKADVKMGGEVLVPGKIFGEFIKKIGENSDIEINDEEDNLIISYLDNKTNLKTLPVNEYPAIKDYEYECKISINQKDFKDLINKTAFASNMNDDNRPVLKGCLLKIEDDVLNSIALDGFRLAMCKKQLQEGCGDYREINIPAKDLVKITKLLENDEENVELCFASKKLIIEVDSLKIISTPLEGFVNYQASIPKDFEAEVTVNTKMLEKAIDRVSTLAKFEKSNSIKIEIKNNVLSVTSNSEYGNAVENMRVLTKGKDMVINYNSKYITDCLKTVEEDYVLLKTNYTNPSIITGVDESEYTFLILPIRAR